MTRKPALATALAVVLTVATASLAVAANLGILTDEEPVGQLAPVPAAGEDPGVPTDAPTIYVDEDGNVLPVPDQPLPIGTDRGPASVPDDPHHDVASEDDGHEDEESGDDEHDEAHEDEEGDHDEAHEGRDDDD